MKRILTLASFLFLLSSFFALPAQAEPVNYTLDPHHTYALWFVNHFGYSKVSGKFIANGTLILDQANPQNSKVNVTINTADLSTAIPEFDEHLKSSDFFDVKQFPTATFVSDSVKVLGKNKAKVHGNLTIHGITKPVTLDVTLNMMGMHPYAKKQAAGFSATTTVKRSDFGMGAYVPNVGDEVKIDIEAEAEKTA
jgi:polyisoprenoid-binding protein YceI